MSKKDTISKEYFKVPERFADICNGVLFDGERVVEPYELLLRRYQRIRIRIS